MTNFLTRMVRWDRMFDKNCTLRGRDSAPAVKMEPAFSVFGPEMNLLHLQLLALSCWVFPPSATFKEESFKAGKLSPACEGTGVTEHYFPSFWSLCHSLARGLAPATYLAVCCDSIKCKRFQIWNCDTDNCGMQIWYRLGAVTST